jgi:hypothetical protein
LKAFHQGLQRACHGVLTASAGRFFASRAGTFSRRQRGLRSFLGAVLQLLGRFAFRFSLLPVLPG